MCEWKVTTGAFETPVCHVVGALAGSTALLHTQSCSGTRTNWACYVTYAPLPSSRTQPHVTLWTPHK